MPVLDRSILKVPSKDPPNFSIYCGRIFLTKLVLGPFNFLVVVDRSTIWSLIKWKFYFTPVFIFKWKLGSLFPQKFAILNFNYLL